MQINSIHNENIIGSFNNQNILNMYKIIISMVFK